MTQALFDVILDASARVLVVALLVAAVLLLARVRSSSVRHAAWTAVMAAMLTMPVLPSIAPPIFVPFPLPARVVTDVPAASAMPSAPGPTVRVQTTSAAPPVQSQAVTARPASSGLDPAVGEPAARGRSIWPNTLLVLYIAGVAVLLTRLLLGILGVRRLVREGTRLDLPDAIAPVYASPAVAVPLTAGVFKPAIVLPASWSTWPAEQLAAVLAHEGAHIRRRDPLVLWLAYLNRSVFWFHPLSWWLERKLAITAEDACDDAAMTIVGHGRRYAEILLEMASAVRRRRGRVAWSGVGIDGSGHLGRRIDRVLGGDILTQTSRARKIVVAIGCAAAIAIAVACRQREEPQPLQEDPAVAERLRTQKARTDFFNAATAMTVDQVGETEAALAKAPDDLEMRRKLLYFYNNSGQKLLGWNEMVAARRRHLVWLIEHHPESDLTYPRGLAPAVDPIGYAEAKKLWTAHKARPGASSAVLSNAAYFFSIADKPIAEEILLRLRATDPNGPQPRTKDSVYYPAWTERLGVLYAQAIVGSNDERLGNVVKSVSVEEAQGNYAEIVRRKLQVTKDPALLVSAGWYLSSGASQAKLPFDHAALGRSYLERALELDPSSSLTKQRLQWMERRDATMRHSTALHNKQTELAGGEIARKVSAREKLTPEEQRAFRALQERAVATLSDEERFQQLPKLATSNYTLGEYYDHTEHDTATANVLWAASKKYAQEVATLAPAFRNSPYYGAAMRCSKLTLGAHALREGDRQAAVRYLNEAATESPSAHDDVVECSLEGRLVNYLLNVGERDSVARYLEQTAETAGIHPDQKKLKLADAAAIRAGNMPPSYQHMFTPR